MLIAAAGLAAVLIAIGLGSYVTSLAHSTRGESYQSYRSEESEKDGPLATVANVSPIKVYRTPCQNPQSETESGLCAQWKAADAAAESARWAGFAGWFGGLSFLGVLAAIGLAFHSNWIAHDTAKRQLRAYLAVHTARIIIGSHSIKIVAEINNSGATPAHKVQLDLDLTLAVGGFMHLPAVHVSEHVFGTECINPIGTLPPNSSIPTDFIGWNNAIIGLLELPNYVANPSNIRFLPVTNGKLSWENVFGEVDALTVSIIYEGVQVENIDGHNRLVGQGVIRHS